MLRTIAVAAVLALAVSGSFVACTARSQDVPDAPRMIDGHPPDSSDGSDGSDGSNGSGSGSDEFSMEDASPRDVTLEAVLGASALIVIVGPTARRRRRRDPNVL